TEIILSECDPDGWAAGSVRENPNFQYRNTEYYASYFAVTACRLLDLSGENGIRTAGMLTWAFEFEEREYFAGLRTLSTNGVDKPVLNAFRLVSQLRGRRARVEVSPLEPPTGRSGEHLAAVAAVGDGGEIQLLIVHHHDDWDTKNGADVRLSISVPAPAREFRVEEIIVDEESSNSYSAWSKLGRPKDPTVEELAEMNRRAMVSVTQRDLAYDSAPLTMELHLRSHAVHLLRIRPLR
ncbi:MAG TPA: hypothetical protein VMV68_09630, partial [Spirochaetia bacterium]|nr:hypothetical protein [Spirochaetia bacterium]